MTVHKDRKPNDSSLEMSQSPNPKSQDMHESTAAYNARLASFPELDPNPVMELDLEARLVYLNLSAKKMFPDIDILGIKHPFLDNWSQLVRELKDAKQPEIISREVQLGGLIYKQIITLSPKNQIRIYAQDITESKKTEEALIQSKAYLQATLNSTGDGILVVDDNQTIISANDHFLEMFGIPRDLIIKKDDAPVLALVVSQMVEPETFLAKVKKLYDSGKIDKDTLHLKDGRIIERYSEPLILQNKIAGRVWSFRDTTELILAEEALKRSEQKYRLIVEKSTDIIFSFNAAGEFLYVSPSIKNLLGYDPNDLLGHPFQALVHPTDIHVIEQAIQRNIKDGSQAPGGNRFRVRNASGDWRWHSTTGNAVYDASGKFVYFIAISRDITEHKKAEELLQATEQNFRNSLESSFMGIRIKDEHDKTLYANQAFLNIFGYSGIDKVGPHPLIEHYTDQEKARYLLRQEKRSYGESVSNDIQVEINGKGGAIRHLQVFLNEIFWDGKKEFQVVYNDITPLKNAEAALKSTEQSLYNSMDKLPIGVRISDNEERTLYLNQAFLKILGYDNIDEVSLMPPLKYYTPASYADYLRRKEKLLRGERRPDEVDLDIIRKDGRIRHLQLSTKGLTWNGRQQFQTIYIDITERKEADDALKMSEQNFRNSMDSSQMGILISNLSGQIFYTNQALLDIFGYKNAEEVKIRWPHEFYTPESYAEWQKRRGRQLNDPQTRDRVEVDIARKDGTIRHLEISVKEVTWDGKKQYQTLYNDVTELKQAEEALHESEEKYRLIVENSRDTIFTINNAEEFAYVSPSITAMLGYHPAQLIGKKFISLVHPDDVHIIGEETQQSYLPGYTVSADNIYRMRHASGEWRWVASRGTRAIDANGNFLNFIGIIRDVTEHKQAEEEKQALEEKAQVNSRLAAVGELAAGIAHEINNPLTSVIGFSQLALAKQNVPDDIKEDLKIIEEGSRRVADIVRRLLTFARQSKPVKIAANINELIDNTLKLREYVLKTNNIEVKTKFDPELPWLTVDPGQLQQVFLNLLVNAEQAMNKSHRRGTLTISTENIANAIRITFQDDGPGIKKEIMERLFEPFFTTKDPGEGTGLGLSLSRSIILEHSGKISVVSEFGHGATFIVELPLHEPPQLERTTQMQFKKDTPAVNKKGRILVVDDEPGVRELLGKVMMEMGHSIDVISDAGAAMEIVGAGTIYDVILADIRMPGMNGVELCTLIMRKNPEMKNRIIVITGDVMGTDIKEFLNTNKLACLAKPFDIKLLKEQVQAIVNSRGCVNNPP